MKRLAMIILSSAALLSALATVAIGRVGWIRAWRATVAVNGRILHSARVYRNRSNECLIDLRGAPIDLFLVRAQSVGIPNRTSLVFFSAFAIPTRGEVLTADLRTEKGGSIEPHPSVSGKKLRFCISNDRTVEVDWN